MQTFRMAFLVVAPFIFMFLGFLLGTTFMVYIATSDPVSFCDALRSKNYKSELCAAWIEKIK